jgi:hypothetical protein
VRLREIVSKVPINPIIRTRTRHSRHAYHPRRDNIYKLNATVHALSKRTYVHRNTQADGISEPASSYSRGEDRKRVIPSKSLYSRRYEHNTNLNYACEKAKAVLEPNHRAS